MLSHNPSGQLSYKHIPALDGVRGLAILLVMFHHFNIMGSATGVDWWVGHATTAGWVGVDLFFVLSGFLITGILIDTKERPGYFRNFYARRVLRIFPLYYGFLFLLLGSSFLLARAYQNQVQTVWANQGWLWAYATNVLLTIRGDWTQAVPGANHFWSLAVEEQFYLVWPLLVWWLSRRQLLWTCVGMIAAAPVIRYALWSVTGLPIGSYVLTPARVDTLAMGAVIAILVRTPAAHSWMRRVAVRVFAVTAVVFGVMVFGEVGWIVEAYAISTIGMTVTTFLFGAILAYTVASPGSLPARIFENPVLRFLGVYSYALYVFHPGIRKIVLRLVPQVPAMFGTSLPNQLSVWIFSFGASAAVALVSWHLFEKHFLRLKRYFEFAEPEVLAAEAAKS